MRTFRNYLLLSCAAVSLAACGGDTAPQTVGSVAAPSAPGGGGTGVTPTPSAAPTPAASPTPTSGSGGGVNPVTPAPTPTPSAGTGGGVTPTPTQPTTPTTFLDVSAQTSFTAVGGFHSLQQETATGATLYQGNANTVRAPGGTVTYNPRDGIFTLAIADERAGVTRDYRFQDPAHRTTPAPDVPSFNGFNYLEVLDDPSTTPPTVATFFYQRPGSSTTYVSLAGFVRSSTTTTAYNAERGVFVFGQLTPTAQVPISGSGAYTGGFIATMVNSQNGQNGSSLQWLSGTSGVNVNFATGAVNLAFNGTASSGHVGGVATNQLQIPQGTSFFANGTASIDLIRSQGFVGQFQSVCFFAACGTAGSMAVDFARVSSGSSTAGASSIDGAFYGPNGVNLGGNFRVVGGVVGQRVDILGAFTGAKQ